MYNRCSSSGRFRLYACVEREASHLLGQVWCWSTVFFLVVVLQVSELEAKGRDAAENSVFIKTSVCCVVRSRCSGDIHYFSPSWHGGGKSNSSR